MQQNKVPMLMPFAEGAQSSGASLAPRLSTLEGKTIGIINNGWKCMQVASQELRQLLTTEYGVSEILEKEITPLQTLSAGDMDELMRRADAVICGVGN